MYKTIQKITLGLVLITSSLVVRAQQPAEIMPLADQALTLSVAKVGTSLIMVGERGHVLKSKDQGKTWHQIENIPVNVTLTKVVAYNNHVWAVGHDTTIIHSKDGGETWELQFNDADREVPLLSAYFDSESSGIVIGAYGTILSTSDGGESWNDELIHDELDYHLNDITKTAEGVYYIAAEAGYAFKSEDDGLTWQEIELPYMGSMFGAVSLADEVVLFGLRGNILISADNGETWDEVYTDIENNLFGSSKMSDNSVLIVGANGTRLIYQDGDVKIMQAEDTGDDYSDAVVNGNLAVLVGETGFINLPIEK